MAENFAIQDITTSCWTPITKHQKRECSALRKQQAHLAQAKSKL